MITFYQKFPVEMMVHLFLQLKYFSMKSLRILEEFTTSSLVYDSNLSFFSLVFGIKASFIRLYLVVYLIKALNVLSPKPCKEFLKEW